MSARPIFIPTRRGLRAQSIRNITQENIRETICNPRWSTKSIRPDESYTHRLKVEQIGEYGYSDSRLKDYEEDHFIPLELGGNPTDPKISGPSRSRRPSRMAARTPRTKWKIICTPKFARAA